MRRTNSSHGTTSSFPTITADPFSTVTAGWNHYFAGHAAKFTFDAQYAFDAITDTAAVPTDTETGLLGDSSTGEVILRAQFQLLF